MLSVGRVTAPVFAESKVGLIFTNGDPTGESKNSVAGADFQYLNSNLLPGKVARRISTISAASRTCRGDDEVSASA